MGAARVVRVLGKTAQVDMNMNNESDGNNNGRSGNTNSNMGKKLGATLANVLDR